MEHRKSTVMFARAHRLFPVEPY